MSTSLPDIGQVTTVDVDGLKIRLACGGRSDGVPVLLTSPWPESIYAFRDILSDIEGLCPLILVDLPGFGRSEGRADLMSPEAMGDFIIELAQHFGIHRMHAVGPDIGTPALLFAAIRRPSLFQSLVLGSGATSTDLAAGGLKDLISAPAGTFDRLEGGDIAVQFVTQSAASLPPPAVIEDYRLSSAGRRFAEAAGFVQAYPRDLPRLKTTLPNIDTPVLVLSGRSDPIVPPSNGELLVKYLPHCRHEVLEGGHLIWEDAPPTYAARLANWLRGGYRSLLPDA